MNYLESLKTFIKENKLLALIVLGALVIIIVISLFSGGGQKAAPTAVSEPVSESFGALPPSPKIQNAILESTPAAVANFLDPLKISMPATARVYAFSQTGTLSLDTVNRLAVRLGFKNKATVLSGGRFNWDEGDSFLHYDSVQDGVVFGLATPINISPEGAASKAAAVSQLLDSLGLNYPDLVIKDTNPTVSGEGVTTFLVPRTVNNLEVSSLPFDPSLVSFDFDQVGQIMGGVYYYHMLQSGSQSYGVYPLKSVDEAVADLNAGRGTLAGLGVDGYAAADITGITSLSISTVKLEYHESRTPQPYLRPVYAFDGTVSLPDGSTTSATYFVDALK